MLKTISTWFRRSTLIKILWSNLTLEQNSFLDLTFCRHSNASSQYSGLLRTSIGVPAESQIQKLFCLSVKFDHNISITVKVSFYSGVPEIRLGYPKFMLWFAFEKQCNLIKLHWSVHRPICNIPTNHRLDITESSSRFLCTLLWII